MSLLVVLGLLSGIAISIQSNMSESLIGNKESIGEILGVLFFREVTPLVITMVIIIRSVTAVTSEIATMKMQSEILALNTMGISIWNYIVFPRIIAGMVSFFAMSVVYYIFGFLGAWLGANYYSYVPFYPFLTSFSNSLLPMDFLFFLLKTGVIGGIIFLRACHWGLRVSGASYQVAIVTRLSVVEAHSIGLFIQFTLSVLFYAWKGF